MKKRVIYRVVYDLPWEYNGKEYRPGDLFDPVKLGWDERDLKAAKQTGLIVEINTESEVKEDVQVDSQEYDLEDPGQHFGESAHQRES